MPNPTLAIVVHARLFANIQIAICWRMTGLHLTSLICQTGCQINDVRFWIQDT